jgi:hypothetical protein
VAAFYSLPSCTADTKDRSLILAQMMNSPRIRIPLVEIIVCLRVVEMRMSSKEKVVEL